jgi:osmotically-inducible protein OsmY
LEDRWPDEGFGDRGGAARRKLLDYEGGYGGGRNRAEQTPEHGFGERGWGGGRAPSEDRDRRSSAPYRNLPEGVHDVGPDDPRWQERYARENSDKYGQGGGQPIRQRGAGQSMGGYEQREQSLGSTRDLSAHGTYGSRETERWPGEGGKFAGKGPKNYKRSDDRIREDVCQRLTDHPAVDGSEIEVAVQDGEVTLTGTVEDRRMKRLAEDLVCEIPGVRDVHNQIRAVQRS